MKQFKVGLQLFGVRKAMQADMDGTLKAVKEMGYDCVEFAGYFGKTAKEVKAILDKYGLKAISVHQEPSVFISEGQSAFDYIKELGVKYCAIPWYVGDEFFNCWDETIEKFTALGKQMKDNGIQLLYHNHDFEFRTIDGEAIIDKMYKEVPADLLQPEFDTCWIRYAGQNPAEYLEKYANRIEVVHLKDFVCDKMCGGPAYQLIGADGSVEDKDDKEENNFRFKPIGFGVQDWASILAACEKGGTEYVIVEQDEWYEDDALECAAKSRKYLKETFGI